MANRSCTRRIIFKTPNLPVLERDDDPSGGLRVLPNLLIPVLEVVVSLFVASAPGSPSTFLLLKRPISVRRAVWIG